MIPNLFPIFMTLSIMGLLDIPLDVATIMIASVVMGIAVDDKGRIFVVDSGLRQILVFTYDGHHIGSVGPGLMNIGREFSEPVDLVINKNMMYVLDRSLSHIYIFRIDIE